jgi:hypothetical protein
LNSQLVVELVVPARAQPNRPVLIQVTYRNPTNSDIAAQSRTLFSEEGLKMAFSVAGVPTGTTALYMELAEQGGPPGIIRAGGGGTINIYTKTPGTVPLDPVIMFKLK